MLVPLVTRFAFFDGIHIFIYLYDFWIVLCEMKTKETWNLETYSRVSDAKLLIRYPIEVLAG